MLTLAQSVEEGLLANAFAASRRVIGGLFLYFAILTVAAHLFRTDNSITRHLVRNIGFAEAGCCLVAAALVFFLPKRVPLVTTIGYASGILCCVVSIAIEVNAGGQLDQMTLCLLTLFLPLLYMMANLSMYRPLIRTSRYGAVAIMFVCAVPLVRASQIDDRWIFIAVVFAAQPSYFVMQTGINTLLRLMLKTSNEAATGRSVMLGMLSHELRTPMQTIRTAADIIKLKAVSSHSDTVHVDRILLASNQLEAQMRDLLEFSRLESGLSEPEWTKFDLREVVLGIVDAYDEAAKAKNNTMRIEHSADSSYVIGDPARVQQVLNNLVSNAIKYTDGGKIELFIKRDQDRRDHVVVTVKDTGIGIEPGKIDSIWMPYTRLQNASRADGYGLGLAIVRMLVKMLGGSITVTSVLGQGSSFTVTLPLRPA